MPRRKLFTTKLKISFLGKKEAQFYEWMHTSGKPREYTLEEIDLIIGPHKISDDELADYVELVRLVDRPFHWSILQSIWQEHKHSNSENVVDDSEEFSSLFNIEVYTKGRIHRKKLYALYYLWSSLPMSREKFFTIFDKTYYPIPKESAMINAFIVRKRDRQRNPEASRRFKELQEILYGQQEKENSKKALWNFW